MSKTEFAKEIGYQVETIEKWCKNEKVPVYIQNALLLAVKAKKYQDYVKSQNSQKQIYENNIKEELKEENTKLKEENKRLREALIKLVG